MNKTSISINLNRWRSTRNPWYLARALYLIFRQRRLVELLYAAYCLVQVKPGEISSLGRQDIDKLIREAEDHYEVREAERTRIVSCVRSNEVLAAATFECLNHGFDCIAGFQVVGEYADASSRIFLLSPYGNRVDNPYVDIPGVRHIHLVCLHKDRLFVSTGDSSKYLDCFRVENNRIQLERRIYKYFGGFTAACTVNGNLYLGTDFSGRPNYILCLETGEKFGFPVLAYKMYVVIMIPLRDNFIICVSVSEPYSVLRRVISIFSLETKSFIYSAEYFGTAFRIPWEQVEQ